MGLFTIPQPANSSSNSTPKNYSGTGVAALAAAPAGVGASAGATQPSTSPDSLDIDLDENAAEASYETDILPADFVPASPTSAGTPAELQWKQRLQRRPAINSVKHTRKAGHRIRILVLAIIAAAILIAMAFIIVVLMTKRR